MADKLDLWKLRLGIPETEAYRVPTADEAINQRIKQIKSNYPLRLLGTSQQGAVHISEEEREVNFHIIGGGIYLSLTR